MRSSQTIVLVGFALAGSATAGSDMLIHFPNFFMAPRAATVSNLQVRLSRSPLIILYSASFALFFLSLPIKSRPQDVNVSLRFPVLETDGIFFLRQAFTGALGGITAEPVTATDDATRPFACNGNTFTTFSGAASRSCNDQQNACSNFANSAAGKSQGVFSLRVISFLTSFTSYLLPIHSITITFFCDTNVSLE